MCIGLIEGHVKKTPYLLKIDLPFSTEKGPKQTIPVKVNGGLSGVTLAAGRSAIFCVRVVAFLLLHTKQLLTIFFPADRPCNIQYRSPITERM